MRSSRKAGPRVRRLDIKAAARADLLEIYEYSAAEFGIKTAEAYLAGLRKMFDRILAYPLSGAVYPDVTPEMRIRSFRRHRIFYHIAGDSILIVRVLHARRDERELLAASD